MKTIGFPFDQRHGSSRDLALRLVIISECLESFVNAPENPQKFHTLEKRTWFPFGILTHIMHVDVWS
jgi:hypothetical protein